MILVHIETGRCRVLAMPTHDRLYVRGVALGKSVFEAEIALLQARIWFFAAAIVEIRREQETFSSSSVALADKFLHTIDDYSVLRRRNATLAERKFQGLPGCKYQQNDNHLASGTSSPHATDDKPSRSHHAVHV